MTGCSVSSTFMSGLTRVDPGPTLPRVTEGPTLFMSLQAIGGFRSQALKKLNSRSGSMQIISTLHQSPTCRRQNTFSSQVPTAKARKME